MEIRISQELLSEWNYKKNKTVSPETVMPHSNKKVWWICKKCSYEWEASPNSRSRGTGCPRCGKIKCRESQRLNRIKKSGSLLQTNPYLAEEWNFERNGELSPSDVTAHSNKKVWWICKEGHEWQAVINSRSSGRGCPECSKERGTSFPEQAIFFYLNSVIKAENRYSFEGVEIDIYIPEMNVGIEYDGIYYHGSKSKRIKDEKKTAFIKEKGIRLIRIVESETAGFEGDIIRCVFKSSYSYLDDVINCIFERLGIVKHPLVNIDKDRYAILEQYYSLAKTNSIVNIKPSLLEDWDYDANGRLNPEYIPYGSNQKVNWKCKECGHKWTATVASRFAGNGCPACGGKVLVRGKNDLLSQNPQLATEWDYENNGQLKPEDITVSNGRRVWWICNNCGNQWLASVAHRNNGNACPICAKNKVIDTRLRNKRIAEGSLLTNYPEVAKEWNYEKNGDLRPEHVTSHSGKKVWWICSTCSTEWEAYISNRVKGHGCPTCFKKMQAERSVRTAFKRNGSIVESNPEILEFWNYNLNKDVSPEMYTKGSQKKVWWVCPVCGYEWQAMVSNLVKGQRCPNCSKHRKRAILQIDNQGNVISEYCSSAEASRKTGISTASISCAANGKKKTAGGFIWRFKD